MKRLLLLFSFLGLSAQAQVSLPPEFIANWQSTQLTCEVWETSTDPRAIVKPKSLGMGILNISFAGDPLIELIVLDYPEKGMKIGQRNALGRLNKSKYDNCFWSSQYAGSDANHFLAYQCHQGDGFRITAPYSVLWFYRTLKPFRICAISGSAPSTAYIARPCLELRSCE